MDMEPEDLSEREKFAFKLNRHLRWALQTGPFLDSENIKRLRPDHLKPLPEDKYERAKDYTFRKHYIKDIIEDARREAESRAININQQQPLGWMVLSGLVRRVETFPQPSNDMPLATALWISLVALTRVLEITGKKSIITEMESTALKLLDRLDNRQSTNSR